MSNHAMSDLQTEETDPPEIYEASSEQNSIELIIEETAWQAHLNDQLISKLLEAALAALDCEAPKAGHQDHNERANQPQLAVLMFSNDETVRELNRAYRGKDKPTNILSFPVNTEVEPISQDQPGLEEDEEDDHIGDAILALETIVKEAVEQEKSFADHLTHLVIHGVLHLRGFDHETEAEALKMETMEKTLLSTFQIMDPYLPY